MTSHARPWATLSLALIPPLLILGGVEAWFRVRPSNGNDTPVRHSTVQPDSELIWKLSPVSEGRYRTNRLGFRDREPDPEAGLRVLLLGDSVSWGHGVGTEEVFAVRLEDALNEADGEIRVDLLNTGVPGYSTFQQLRYLELRGLALEPDAVVLQICLNDVVERFSALAAWGGSDFFLGIDTRGAVPGAIGWLLRNSRAYAALAARASDRDRRREEYDVQQLISDELAPHLEEAWATLLGEVDALHALTTERGIPLLIVVTPYRFQILHPLRDRQPQDRLIAHAEQLGVPIVDLLPAFATARRSGRARPFRDASHFSAAGHDIAAESLVEPVRNLIREGPTRTAPGTAPP